MERAMMGSAMSIGVSAHVTVVFNRSIVDHLPNFKPI